MKKTPLASIILTLALSFPVLADISADMANADLTLVQVVQNAQDDGLSIAEILAQMLAEDPDQSSAIIASAIVVEPGMAAAIVTAAIDAGVEPASVVSAALVASDGVGSSVIINAAIAAAPDSSEAIILASVNVLPSTAAGFQPTGSSVVAPSVPSTLGGGSGNSASPSGV